MMSLLRTMGSAMLVLALAASTQAQLPITPVSTTSAYTVAITNAPVMTEIPSMTTVGTVDDFVNYVPLTFPFVFFNRTFNSVNISSNGNIQFRTAANGATNAFFGTAASTAATYTPAIAYFMTDLNPALGGVHSYAFAGTAPNRQFILRANNVKYYQAGANDTGLISEVVLTEGTNTIDMRYYQIAPSSVRSVEIGLQDASNNVASSTNGGYIFIWNDRNFSDPAAISALVGKQVRWTPVNSVPAGTPEPPVVCEALPTSTNASYSVATSAAAPVPNLAGATMLPPVDDAVNNVPIGFPFTFYGRQFTSVNVSTNGNLQFVTQISTSSASFFGTSSSSYAPAIAVLHADLKPYNADSRMYLTTGTPPNRRFIVRYNDVPYYFTGTAPANGTGLLADVVFTETTNTIDLIYYRIPVSTTRDVEIGIQNSGVNDWIALWNDERFSQLCADGFNGKQFRFTPAGGAVIPPTSSTGAAAASSSTGAVASSSTGAVRSSSSSPAIPTVSSSSSSPAVIPSSSTGAATPSSSSIPVVIPSSSTAAPIASSSTAAATSIPIAEPSSSLPVVDPSSSGSVLPPDFFSSSSEQVEEKPEDGSLNGAASINSVVAFAVLAISMVLAL